MHMSSLTNVANVKKTKIADAECQAFQENWPHNNVFVGTEDRCAQIVEDVTRTTALRRRNRALADCLWPTCHGLTETMGLVQEPLERRMIP